MKVGLTGNIGCGKSSVLNIFDDNDWSCLSADLITHEILSSNKLVYSKIKEKFGLSVLNTDGSINRKRLSKIVFSNEHSLSWLESLLHPIVITNFVNFIKENKDLKICVEIPLLFEKRLEKYFDYIVCISCSDKIVDNRLQKKGMSLADINLRRSQQFSLLQKEILANFVLENEGSIEFLEFQTNKLIHTLKNYN